MIIDRLVLGAFETNCYVLRKTEQQKECLIIDTGLDGEKLLSFLQQKGLTPEMVVMTHGHADHIAGFNTLKEKYPDTKLAIFHADADMLTDAGKNLSMLAGVPVTCDSADVIIDRPGPVQLAGIKLDVIHTPGHTPGGICLYNAGQNVLFSGDSLFAGSIGRTDFPGSDHQKLIDALKNSILTLPGQTVVYPGHGPATTIAQEKAHNPFLRS